MRDEALAFYSSLSEQRKELFLILIAIDLTTALRAVYVYHHMLTVL